MGASNTKKSKPPPYSPATDAIDQQAVRAVAQVGCILRAFVEKTGDVYPDSPVFNAHARATAVRLRVAMQQTCLFIGVPGHLPDIEIIALADTLLWQFDPACGRCFATYGAKNMVWSKTPQLASYERRTRIGLYANQLQRAYSPDIAKKLWAEMNAIGCKSDCDDFEMLRRAFDYVGPRVTCV